MRTLVWTVAGALLAVAASGAALVLAALLWMLFMTGDLPSRNMWVVYLAFGSVPLLFLGACILAVPKARKVGTVICVVGASAMIPAWLYMAWSALQSWSGVALLLELCIPAAVILLFLGVALARGGRSAGSSNRPLQPAGAARRPEVATIATIAAPAAERER
jgi:hypothetical protein